MYKVILQNKEAEKELTPEFVELLKSMSEKEFIVLINQMRALGLFCQDVFMNVFLCDYEPEAAYKVLRSCIHEEQYILRNDEEGTFNVSPLFRKT